MVGKISKQNIISVFDTEFSPENSEEYFYNETHKIKQSTAPEEQLDFASQQRQKDRIIELEKEVSEWKKKHHDSLLQLSQQEAELKRFTLDKTKDAIQQSTLSGNELTSNKSDKDAVEKNVDEIQECGCPNTKTIQRLMRKFSNEDCRLSDCTDYELNVSDLEKPEYPYTRYDGVVVVTKVHWAKDLGRLQQMICLFTAAYNRHAGYYDIVVFTTIPWTATEVKAIQDVALPANLRVVVDSPPLEDVLSSMTEEEVSFLKRRCKCASNVTLTWFHHCTEPNYAHAANVAYSWQAEFRSYHIWKEPVLATYKYMIWMDSDALPTKMWNKDPMKLMVENDLVVMYAHFPQGGAHVGVEPKMLKVYNRSICDIKDTDGYFNTTPCVNKNHTIRLALANGTQHRDEPVKLGLIHGFHHITNMDFYRSERTMRFLASLIGEYKFTRKYDDQIAVTLPAAMDAPNRSWDYRLNGLSFSMSHNGDLDGEQRTPNKIHGYHKFHWQINRKKWVAGARMCNQWIQYMG